MHLSIKKKQSHLPAKDIETVYILGSLFLLKFQNIAYTRNSKLYDTTWKHDVPDHNLFVYEMKYLCQM